MIKSRLLVLCSVLLFTVDGAASDKVLAGKEDWLFPAWERTDQIYHEGVAASLSLIVQGAGILTRAGTRVYVGIVPTKARIYPEKLPDGAVISSDFKNLYAELNTRLTTSKIQTLDLLTPLINGKAERPMFAHTDSHWTAYGADLAAKAAGEFLRPHVADLPGKKPPGPQPGFVTTPILGDLAKVAGRSDLEQVWIRPDPSTTALNLLDDDSTWDSQDAAATQIALVCTSMCAPPLGFPVSLSHTLGKPVDLYWRVGSYGHWRILSDYLTSLQQRKQPLPKTLIWIVMEGSMVSGPDDPAWGEFRMSPDAWLNALSKATQ